MIKTYLFLIGAILCEVAGTMLLPISQNFTKMIPTFTLSMFYLLAFYLLTFVINKLTYSHCICDLEWSWNIHNCYTGLCILLNKVYLGKLVMGLFLIILGVVLVNSLLLQKLFKILKVFLLDHLRLRLFFIFIPDH